MFRDMGMQYFNSANIIKIFVPNMGRLDFKSANTGCLVGVFRAISRL